MPLKSLLRLFCLLFALSGGLSGAAQNFNRPVPPGYYPYEFEPLDSSYTGYYFVCPHQWGNWLTGGTMGMLDRNGYLVWYATPDHSPSDFKWLPHQQRFTVIGRRSTNNVQYYTLDSSLALVDSVTAQLPATPDTHEFLTLDNGHRLILVVVDTVMDLSNHTFNGLQGMAHALVKGMGIQEFDLQGQLVWEWRSTDHIHPSEFIDNYFYNSNYFDYAHGNSISQDSDGHLLVSFRHLDAVYKIDHSSGQVIWRLGGRSSDFRFPNDPEAFSGQHSARRLPNGRYGLYDNGNQKALPRRSRAVEYALDTVNWTATLAYSYGAGDSIYADATGNYEYAQPGYRIVGWGNVRRPEPSATLLDSLGQVVSQLHFENEIVSYRVWASTLPFELERPEISCLGNGPGITLSAPAGHSHYIWSTGETTPDITVSDTGVYQVWVPQGIGMVGSPPLPITDLTSPCGLVAAAEAVPPAARPDAIMGYYNLSGQAIARPRRGQPHVVRYRSGRAQLKVVY